MQIPQNPTCLSLAYKVVYYAKKSYIDYNGETLRERYSGSRKQGCTVRMKAEAQGLHVR